MVRRHREILSAVLNSYGYITGNDLANLLGVSDRTIQSDIKKINIILKEYNIKINSAIKKGYYLTEEDKNTLKKNDIIRSVLDYEYIEANPATPMERELYIMLKATTKEYVSIEELSDSLYVSASTINNDINTCKKWLKENLNIDIHHSLTRGLKLKCDEIDKRNIISWIIGNRNKASEISKYWNYLFDEKEITRHTRNMYELIDKKARKYGYYLSGYSCQLSCLEILVASRRYKLGFQLDSIEKQHNNIMPMIEELKEEVHKYLDFELPDIEWSFIQEYFKAKQFIHGTYLENIITEDSLEVLDEFAEGVLDKIHVDLRTYPKVKDTLLLYIAPMLERVRLKQCIAEIDENIKNIYPDEFNVAKTIIPIINKKLNSHININEIIYITIYLVSINGMWIKKLNTIIVSDYNENVLGLIKSKVSNATGEKINFVGLYTYQQFRVADTNNLKDVDFIITTSTLADRTNIPFIQITPIMDQKDIMNLYEYLEVNNK
jgi:lichenan operon transcriptional antiterminator